MKKNNKESREELIEKLQSDVVKLKEEIVRLHDSIKRLAHAQNLQVDMVREEIDELRN